jgi:hypothetical protein
MRPATSSFFVNKLVFTSTPASTSGTGYSASTSGSSLTRGVYRTKCCRGGSRRHGVNESSRSRRRFLAVNPSSATPSSTRWRGQAGGPHQLVVTMENLAGPHAVPIRILRVARQSGRATSAGGHHGGPRRATRSSHPESPGRLVNSKNNSVERNDGSFQRRLELEDRRSALKPSRPSSQVNTLPKA